MIRVSVIIPIRNEESFVSKCLDSVLGQIQDRKDIQILCVDGASEDGTRDIVLEYTARDARVKLLDNPGKTAPMAMNLGIRATRGDIIIRMDCHCEYAPDYIEKCIEVLQRTGADNVGGYIRTLPGRDTPTGRAIAAATSSRFGVGGSVFRTGGGEQEVDTVPFGCFRRDVFERFGMYDERLVRNQDIELNSRIRAGGGRIVISPEIRLTYFNRSTFAGIRQQAFNNGLWNPYTIYLTGKGLRIRHFVPLAFVSSIAVLGGAGAFLPHLWLLLGGEIAVYLLAASVAALLATRRDGVNWFWTLLTFVQLHLSYGIGSLWGVLTAVPKFGIHPGKAVGAPLPDRRD